MNSLENSGILAFSELLDNILKKNNTHGTPAIEDIPAKEDNMEKKPNEKNIFEKTDEKINGDDNDMINDMNYCKCNNESSVENPYKCGSIWMNNKHKCCDDCKCNNNFKYEDSCKFNDCCNSCEYSDDDFKPVYCNSIRNISKMNMITTIAEGRGTITNITPPIQPQPCIPCNTCYPCSNNVVCNSCYNPIPPVSSSQIAFNFHIGKNHNSYFGNISLVNYNEKLFINSDDLKCFYSYDHTRFVAIFHLDEYENSSREITIFGTTQICNILPTLFIYSAPNCGEDDEIIMGGSVTSGAIKIYPEEDDEFKMHC